MKTDNSEHYEKPLISLDEVRKPQNSIGGKIGMLCFDLSTLDILIILKTGFSYFQIHKRRCLGTT